MATDYCEFSDVQALIAQHKIAVTGTKPTKPEVEEWISEATAQIDGVLASADYPTEILPGTYPESFKILTNLCAMEVASRVIMVSQYSMDLANSEQAAFYHEQFESGMKKIVKIPNFLHDAASEGVGGGARMRSFATDNTDDALDPAFTRDMEM